MVVDAATVMLLLILYLSKHKKAGGAVVRWFIIYSAVYVAHVEAKVVKKVAWLVLCLCEI